MSNDTDDLSSLRRQWRLRFVFRWISLTFVISRKEFSNIFFSSSHDDHVDLFCKLRVLLFIICFNHNALLVKHCCSEWAEVVVKRDNNKHNYTSGNQTAKPLVIVVTNLALQKRVIPAIRMMNLKSKKLFNVSVGLKHKIC